MHLKMCHQQCHESYWLLLVIPVLPSYFANLTQIEARVSYTSAADTPSSAMQMVLHFTPLSLYLIKAENLA